jgi:hypothetical protein
MGATSVPSTTRSKTPRKHNGIAASHHQRRAHCTLHTRTLAHVHTAHCTLHTSSKRRLEPDHGGRPIMQASTARPPRGEVVSRTARAPASTRDADLLHRSQQSLSRELRSSTVAQVRDRSFPPPRTHFPTVQNIREVCLNGCMRVSGTARKCSPRRRTNLSPRTRTRAIRTRTRAIRLAGWFKFDNEAVETGKSCRRGRACVHLPSSSRHACEREIVQKEAVWPQWGSVDRPVLI